MFALTLAFPLQVFTFPQNLQIQEFNHEARHCTTIVASTTAFALSKVAHTSTALNAFESELGIQPPLGFSNPLELLDNADKERFDRLRYVEIKHGCISQLVFLGQIVHSSLRNPPS